MFGEARLKVDDVSRRAAIDGFAEVAEHTPAMLWRGDEAGKCVYLNKSMRAFWGVPDDGIGSFTWASTLLEEDAPNPALLHSQILEEDRAAFTAAEEAAFAAMKPLEAEARIRKPDGEVRWYRCASAPRQLSDGSVVWDGVQIDIHDMKVAEERRMLLMKEMSHRIKNNLSTVLSIATQTGRHAADYAAFNKSFQSRLVALAKSHDLLMKDARGTADLREILEAELLPYSVDTALGRTLTLSGEAVRLSSRAAVGFGLVVHELATNAAKYGAYAGAGSIDVSWRVSDGPIMLQWRERGGPPVSPPLKSGFGSKLIDSVLRGELGGAVEARFAPQGFEADLHFQRVSPGEDG